MCLQVLENRSIPKSELPKKQKLLIVSALFWPDISPRGHRWTKLAVEMARNGHEITVITARQKGLPDLDTLEGVEIRRVGFASLFDFANHYFFLDKQSKQRLSDSSRSSFLNRFAHFFHQKVVKRLFLPDESSIWVRPAARAARAVLDEKKIDALITVSLPFAANMVGQRLKKERPSLTWVCDMGDPLALLNKKYGVLRPFELLAENAKLRIERSVFNDCDAATVTNEATRASFVSILPTRSFQKIFIAPPVFEREPTQNDSESSLVSFEKNGKDELNLAFFGSIYGPFRSTETFLDFLEKTKKRRPELAQKIKTHFFGAIKPHFLPRLSANPHVVLHGQKSRSDAQAFMRDASVLINIGNKVDYLLPSKAVDYFASGRPVLNFSSAEKDPFSAFFENRDNFLDIVVPDGRLCDRQLENIWAWLEAEKKPADEAATACAIEPFLTKNVAKTVLETLEKAAARA